MPDVSMGYREFFRRLGLSRETYRQLVAAGVLPAPPRMPGVMAAAGRAVRHNWTEGYLRACLRALHRREQRHVSGLRRRVQAVAAEAQAVEDQSKEVVPV
jgi:hypothetical protein